MLRHKALVLSVAILIIGLAATYFTADYNYRLDMANTDDIGCALLMYMEENNGNLPASDTDLKAAKYITVIKDGSIVVKLNPNSKLVIKTRGRPIYDLSSFKIKWGTKLETLRIADGRVLNSEGNEVIIFESPLGTTTSRNWSVELVKTANLLSR